MDRLFVHRFKDWIQDEPEGDPAFDTARERHDENRHERREVFAEIGPVDIADVRQHERTDDDERRRRDGGDTRDGTDERAEEKGESEQTGYDRCRETGPSALGDTGS